MIKRIMQWLLPILFLLALVVCAFRVWYYPDTRVCGTVNPNTVSSYQTTGKYPSWLVIAEVDFGTEKSWRQITQADLAQGTFCKRVRHITAIDFIGMYVLIFILLIVSITLICYLLHLVYGSNKPTTREF